MEPTIQTPKIKTTNILVWDFEFWGLNIVCLLIFDF